MTDQPKLDVLKTYAAEYVKPKKPVLVDIPEGAYLTIGGQGAPGGEEFQARIGALYSMAYTTKMTRKFGGRQDYTIAPLEAQWWTDAGSCLEAAPKETWRWRLLIRTPEFVTQDEVRAAIASLQSKGKSSEAVGVRLERFTEGQCVQMLHIGPYDQEAETIAQMVALAESQGLRPNGRHHEIYLSDPRRVPPERLKTILRLPVEA